MRRIAKLIVLVFVIELIGRGTSPTISPPLPAFGTGEPRLVAAAAVGPSNNRSNAYRLGATNVSIYSDGRVIAYARYETHLSEGELTALLAALLGTVSGRPASLSPDSDVQVIDASTAIVTVRHADEQLRQVSLVAFSSYRTKHAYPQPLIDAWDRLQRIAEQAKASGKRYQADRVRLAMLPATSVDGAAATWPGDIPVPSVSLANTTTLIADLDGAAARNVAASVAVDSSQPGPWPVFRTPAGVAVGLSWRYLLPDE